MQVSVHVVYNAERVFLKKECTRIQYAILYKSTEDVLHILKDYKGNINTRGSNGHTAVHLAALRNKPYILAELLSAGAHIDLPDDYGITPLWVAYSNGSYDAVRFLQMNNNVNLSTISPMRTCLLHHPEYFSSETYDLFEDIVNRVPHLLSVRDSTGAIPLHSFCRNPYRRPFVLLLLEKGSDVNAKENFRDTPLHFACYANLSDLVRLLLWYGASLDIRNDGMYKPEDLTEDPNIQELLETAKLPDIK